MNDSTWTGRYSVAIQQFLPDSHIKLHFICVSTLTLCEKPHIHCLEKLALFSSRELFWEKFVVVVVCVVVINFSHFHLLVKNHWTNFKQTWHKLKHSWVKGIRFVQMKSPALFQGKIITNSKNILTKFKNLLLKNHRTNFNQTWQEASFGEGDQSLFKWRVLPFSKWRLLWNSKNTLTEFENLLKNHRTNVNQTWHNASLREGDSSLIKWRTIQFS